MKQITFNTGQLFTPSKIVGVGQNYPKHIKEMKSKKAKEPVIFLKPNSALHEINTPIPIPNGLGSVHHEIELAVCIGRRSNRIDEDEALNYIAGYGLALDLTLRDLQSEAKKRGLPWALAKGFDYSCPVSHFVSKDSIPDVHNLNLKLEINGDVRQQGNTSEMIFNIPFLVSYISLFYTLVEGDIILTGTPSGVGPLRENDVIKASIDGISSVETTVILPELSLLD